MQSCAAFSGGIYWREKSVPSTHYTYTTPTLHNTIQSYVAFSDEILADEILASTPTLHNTIQSYVAFSDEILAGGTLHPHLHYPIQYSLT